MVRNYFALILLLIVTTGVFRGVARTMEFPNGKVLSTVILSYFPETEDTTETDGEEVFDEPDFTSEEDISFSENTYTFWDEKKIDLYNLDMTKMKDTFEINFKAFTTNGFGFVFPLLNQTKVNSPFGPRSLYGHRFHYGLDLECNTGDTVVCTLDGVVRVVRFEKGYGNFIIVTHKDGLETLYGHLSKVAVIPGQEVFAGSTLGYAGSTGRSSGPHLHFEFRFMGEPIDPTRIVNLDTKDLIADTISIDQGWFRHLTNPGPTKSTSFSGYHTIRKGDTLSGISKKYHVSVSRICKMNRITPTTTLKLGRKLKLV